MTKYGKKYNHNSKELPNDCATARNHVFLSTLIHLGNVVVILIFHIYKSRLITHREIMNRGYRGGIYQYSRCTGGTTHVVAVVGYADQYWEIRNSWGEKWGEKGERLINCRELLRGKESIICTLIDMGVFSPIPKQLTGKTFNMIKQFFYRSHEIGQE